MRGVRPPAPNLGGGGSNQNSSKGGGAANQNLNAGARNSGSSYYPTAWYPSTEPTVWSGKAVTPEQHYDDCQVRWILLRLNNMVMIRLPGEMDINVL
jgi:hypothetical protein